MKVSEIIASAQNNYVRNLPLTKVKMLETIQDTYTDIVMNNDWQDSLKNVTITDFDTTNGELLPEDFVNFNTDFSTTTILIDDDVTNDVEIVSKSGAILLNDINEVDDEVTYLTIEDEVDQATGDVRKRLVFVAGNSFSTIRFTYKAGPEQLEMESTPQLIHKDYHNMLVYAFAKKILQGRDLDANEQQTFALAVSDYRARLEDYHRYNNRILDSTS